jgi:uracil-DNA glycosylase family 4
VSTQDQDVAQLREAALAYLAWEAELSGFGVPRREAPAAHLGTPPPEPAQAREPEPPRAPAAPAPVQAPSLDRRALLAQLETEVRACVRCELAKARTQTVFARGNPDSPLVLVGEGPGQEEDRLGSPFVGPAGQLLDKMVLAMGFPRDDVYICNVVKCRPPGNRTPLPSEAGACAPFLLGQLDAIAPRVIVALGRCAAENMGLVSGGSWRGRWGKFRGIDVMPTYHPAFLLRSPEFKRPVWEDLQKVMARLKQGP